MAAIFSYTIALCMFLFLSLSHNVSFVLQNVSFYRVNANRQKVAYLTRRWLHRANDRNGRISFVLVTSGVRAVLNEFNKTVEQSDVGVPRSATKTLEARRAMQGSISRLGIIAVFPLFAIKVIEAAVDFRQWTISRQLRHRQKFTKASLSLLLTNSLSPSHSLALSFVHSHVFIAHRRKRTPWPVYHCA